MQSICKSKLNELGDMLIKHIKSKRDNIFETINIIFPNKKLEQWFKAYWLKTEDTVLMNIACYSLENGLLSLMNDANNYSLANKNDFKAVIIKQLAIIDKNKLDSKISKYIYDNNNNLDSIKLYDLANALADLFIEYEKECIEITGYQKLIYDNALAELANNNIKTFASLANSSFKNIKEVIFFGFYSIDKIYENTINKLAEATNVIMYRLDDNSNNIINPRLLSAPSKMREIELVHSEICKLIKDGNTVYSDILVLCPNIKKYENDISRVFNQDNALFPNIHYGINSRSKQEGEITLGIKKLFEIANKGFYTRLDFSELINNRIIQKSRNIELSDVDNWTRTIIDTNVYRNGKEIDDWDYIKKRVLLSKISNINDINNNIVELSGSKYIPYSNIDFDDSSIIKFVNIIDDLKSWLNNINLNSIANKDNIYNLENELSKWFSIKDANGFEENSTYRKFIKEIYSWDSYKLIDCNIPLKTLFYTLFDLSKINMNKYSNLFTEGITFADIDERSILSAKHIFIIGLGSNEYPTKNIKDDMDLREELKDNSYNAFILQCSNASDSLYLSYVNYNLKTEEKYYPSSYIYDLYKMLNIKFNEEKTGIDEKREWKDLFTKREYKEKGYYYGLLDNPDEEDNNINLSVKYERVKNVTASKMKNFLTEPLMAKAKQLFGNDDDTSEEINDEYEPIKLNNLDRYNILKDLISKLLKNQTEDAEELLNQELEFFDLKHMLPNLTKIIKDNAIKELKDVAKESAEKIKGKMGDNFKIKNISDVTLEIENEKICLTYKDEICISEAEGNTRKYIELRELDNKKQDADFLNIYIASLMDVSVIKDTKTYNIELHRGDVTKKYSITPQDAQNILIDIYNAMNDPEFNVFLPLNFVVENKNAAYDDIVKNANELHNVWIYFKDRKLFNVYKDLGYSPSSFNSQYEKMRLQLLKLIKYIKVEEDNSDGKSEKQ